MQQIKGAATRLAVTLVAVAPLLRVRRPASGGNPVLRIAAQCVERYGYWEASCRGRLEVEPGDLGQTGSLARRLSELSFQQSVGTSKSINVSPSRSA